MTPKGGLCGQTESRWLEDLQPRTQISRDRAVPDLLAGRGGQAAEAGGEVTGQT